MSDIELRSLAPNYVEEHHKTYVSRLNAAVVDPRNRNIALTGRYGAGKSSILDKFIEIQGHPDENSAESKKQRRKKARSKTVLRISINTLGPDDSEDLTNRIQKELVKQLVYRAKPGELRTSKFARAPELKWWRAGIDALAIAAALVGLLWLFGLRPNRDSMGTDGFLIPMIAFFALVFASLWAIRWYIGSRVVAQVSAGGASIALEGKDDSFFDKYLDELVAFFETTEPDIVVFEDLDRFDDPRIFDSLRELNTLVNTSAHWVSRADKPLRFVYAIKDSLFEKLGDEQQEKDAAGRLKTAEVKGSGPTELVPAGNSNIARVVVSGAKDKDTAAEAVERANRTKFFEIVIPVVPFLSHSNARDHFLKELEKLDLPDGTEIDRGLIDVVARHTTDMRLMINIGNEFVVYAERLLWVEEPKRAPGVTANRLFALVVYKNFHLTDFEALPHRGSVLDTLEKLRRDLVDSAIENLRTERADLVQGMSRLGKQQDLATKLGHRLEVYLASFHATLEEAMVHNVALDIKKIRDRAFWQTVGRAGSFNPRIRFRSGHTATLTFEAAELKSLFPEASDSSEWLAPSATRADQKRITAIDTEIAALRGMNFKSLVENDQHTYNGKTFDAIVEETLPSRLARDLVKRGHIDRFYAEYATVFYGEFLGVDVANFFRNSVWPNELDMQFAFTTDGAVGNVLVHAPVGFLGTRSALNIEIVDHLMGLKPIDSRELIEFLARPSNQDGRKFLKTYFNTPRSLGEKLAELLAKRPWSALFNFVAAEGSIETDETKVLILSAALLSVRKIEDFDLDDAARQLIARLHAQIPAFSRPQSQESSKVLFEFLVDALPSIPKIRSLSPELQKLAVDAKRFQLTAGNLRAALSLASDDPLSADNLVANESVWEYCVEHVDDYHALIESDEHTISSCNAPHILAKIINEQHKTWSSEQMKTFLDASAKSTVLTDIVAIEPETWRMAVEAFRILPNFANLQAYVAEIGVDDALGRLLTDDADSDGVVEINGVEAATEEQLGLLIPALLNAADVLEPRQRVLLAKQLLAAPESPGLDLSEIEASPDTLLAELLREKLAEDSGETFTHFLNAGWPSIEPALLVSTNASTFLIPSLVAGNAADLVRNSQIPVSTRRRVLERVTEFAPTNDSTFLCVAAATARTLGLRLSSEALMLVAPAIHNYEDVVWQLREHGASMPANTVMQVLGKMSGDFIGFAEPSGHKFEVPDTASLRIVLDRLKGAGVLAFQRGGQPKARWKLRVV